MCSECGRPQSSSSQPVQCRQGQYLPRDAPNILSLLRDSEQEISYDKVQFLETAGMKTLKGSHAD